jgi:hypothetical protein
MQLLAGFTESRDTDALLELFSGDIAPFYEPRLPYHNWDEHVVGGIDDLRRICDTAYEKRGTTVARLKAGLAWLGHDAGYGHDLLEPDIWQPFGSKEGYSVHITGELLSSYGCEPELIEDVGRIIINGTQLDRKPDSNEAVAVRMTDLANIAGSFQGFILNSCKLMEEDRIYGRQRTLSEFKSAAKTVLNSYLDADFVPVDSIEEPDGTACFVAAARRNIERFVLATPKGLIKELGAAASRFSGLLQRE